MLAFRLMRSFARFRRICKDAFSTPCVDRVQTEMAANAAIYYAILRVALTIRKRQGGQFWTSLTGNAGEVDLAGRGN